MNIPPPSDRQTRILWFSLTTLGVSVLLALVGMLIWGIGIVLDKLSGVLLPLAFAAIVAYLLDPVVDWVEKKFSRTTSVILVFLVVTLVILGMMATVVPRLVVETQQLIERIPEYAENAQTRVSRWLSNSRWADQFQRVLSPGDAPTNRINEVVATNGMASAITNQVSVSVADDSPLVTGEMSEKIVGWITKALPVVGKWFLAQIQRAASWFGLFLGLLLVPVYAFYLLREKKGIERDWTDYLPMRESKVKQETIFVISSINESLIVFFRGQVLVALCTGTLLTISFFVLGLNYALLLGVMAGILGIIPYLGVMISLIPAVTLAAVQFGDWLHPILVVVIFGIVNLLEGLVISPKIIGDRVGLHPLTVIIAVMIGTSLMGGIMGGVLAIPLTAALRAMMFRYVWKKERI